MLQLRLSSPTALTPDVLDVLAGRECVSSLAIMRGASLQPPGDLILADVAREGADELTARLLELGVHREGTLHLQPARAWVSEAGRRAEAATPGSGADSVVWVDVTQAAYEDSELNWTFTSLMILATLLAGIAIILDSQILVIGAMVLGPEFGAVAALGLALVRHRPGLLLQACRSLAVGFALAIAVTALAALLARSVGWLTAQQVLAERPGTGFIYQPDKWSFLVSVIAAAAGVLSMTSARVGGMAGVFISVTTVPAAGNIALGLAVGAWQEVWGSAAQLIINVVGMAIAGWLTLLLQHSVTTHLMGRWKNVKHDRLR